MSGGQRDSFPHYLVTALGKVKLTVPYGVHHYHLMVCEALGLDHTWYEVVDSA
jgi:hypothetical protein